jgi:glycosyltransferase involved in cell wall biosynthesis
MDVADTSEAVITETEQRIAATLGLQDAAAKIFVGASTRTLPTVDIVIPVYNEEATLESSVRRLRTHLAQEQSFRGRVVIADNGSSDSTPLVGKQLSRQLRRVQYRRIEQPGRGRALRLTWMQSDADIVAYMDADLSTDLAALEPLISLIASDRADIAIGSRLAPGAHIKRSRRREFISRTYNRLLRIGLHVSFRDAQCGFKAMRRDLAQALLPEVEDQAWFFDTELLVRAERAGLRVVEVPVAWVEDPTSTVRILRTAMDDIRGVLRLRRDYPRPIPAASVAHTS